MGARILVIALALVGATAAISQTLPLTLTNLKGPIARICGQKPAASIAALWKQIAACGPAAAPSPTPTATAVPVPTPTPPAKPIRLFVGDSLSVFWGGNHTGAHAAAHPELDVRSEAIGGTGLDGVTGNRLSAALALKPRDVIIFMGANCLDKLLSCSDGELGDGTMLRRAVQTYKAEPRLVPVPARPAA